MKTYKCMIRFIKVCDFAFNNLMYANQQHALQHLIYHIFSTDCTTIKHLLLIWNPNLLYLSEELCNARASSDVKGFLYILPTYCTSIHALTIEWKS